MLWNYSISCFRGTIAQRSCHSKKTAGIISSKPKTIVATRIIDVAKTQYVLLKLTDSRSAANETDIAESIVEIVARKNPSERVMLRK